MCSLIKHHIKELCPKSNRSIGRAYILSIQSIGILENFCIFWAKKGRIKIELNKAAKSIRQVLPMFAEYLPTDVVDDLSQLKVVEHFNVVSRLCAKLIALLVAEHVRVGGCGRHQSSLRQVHLDQILYLWVTQGTWLMWKVCLRFVDHFIVTFVLIINTLFDFQS